MTKPNPTNFCVALVTFGFALHFLASSGIAKSLEDRTRYLNDFTGLPVLEVTENLTYNIRGVTDFKATTFSNYDKLLVPKNFPDGMAKLLLLIAFLDLWMLIVGSVNFASDTLESLSKFIIKLFSSSENAPTEKALEQESIIPKENN